MQKLFMWLRNEPFDIWYDRIELRAGDSLIERINSGISGADILRVIVTEISKESEWVQREVSLAIAKQKQRKGPRIIPLLLEDSEVPGNLVDTKHIPISTQDLKVREIISAIYWRSYKMDLFISEDNFNLIENNLNDQLQEYSKSSITDVHILA